MPAATIAIAVTAAGIPSCCYHLGHCCHDYSVSYFAPAIVSVKVTVSKPSEFVAFTPMVYEPLFVGVPEIVPVVDDNTRPSGRVPVSVDQGQVIGADPFAPLLFQVKQIRISVLILPADLWRNVPHNLFVLGCHAALNLYNTM
jgi:hypothetical protein